MRTTLIFLVLGLVLTEGRRLSGEDLRELRSEVRQDDSASARPRYESSGHGHCDDDCGTFDDMLSHVCGVVLLSPWWGPHALLETDQPPVVGFADYPYAVHDGYLVSSPVIEQQGVHPFAVRLALEHGTNFDDLSRTGGRVIVESEWRWGIDAEWDFRREQLLLNAHDELVTGDGNVIVRFAQSDAVQFRTGLGCNWLADSTDSDFGINFTYGVDLFPVRPWVISADLDAGTLGESVLLHGRGSVGVLWRAAEFYAAYDSYTVGGFTQHGPAVGVRWWW